MTAHAGLVVAIELATRKRDEAGHALALMVRKHDNAQVQLDQLQSYAADTQARWSVSAQVSATPQIVGHYYQFMARLEDTVVLQQGVIADVLRQSQVARRLLVEADIRVAGLTRLLDQRQQEITRLAVRREQKQSDEFAARQHRVAATSRALRENP
jgi:flagellar FliJ protein